MTSSRTPSSPAKSSSPVPISWAQGVVASGGEQIYWEGANLEADAPAVVLTHGAGGNHAVWFQQLPALAQHYRVITWDSRGFGNSTCVTETLGVAAATEDLAAVLEAAGVDDAHLVGQSMGGWWITGFALAHPSRVLSLSYCDTIGGLYTPELRSAFAEFQKGGGLAPAKPGVGQHRAFVAELMQRRPDLAFLYQQLGTFADPPMGLVVRALQEGVDPNAIASLGVPLLVLAGEHDGIFPPHLLKAMAETVGAEWVEIAAAGHSPYFERADEFNAALGSFLARVAT